MLDVICDASIVVKWFHDEDETDPARTLLRAHQERRLNARVLDLTLYELGNVLLRRLHWGGAATAAQLRDLVAICGPPVHAGADEQAGAAGLADDTGLTFYDAAYAAVARERGATLVTADRELLAAGAGVTAAALVERL